MSEIRVSNLSKTWIFDLDGTIVKHNGYIIDGYDSLLPGAKDYIDNIPADDMILIITARKDEFRNMTLDFLHRHHIRYDHIIFNAPVGERILINDKKPSGLKMSISINTDRDVFMHEDIITDDQL